MEWYRKAAEGEYAAAQYALGYLYYGGKEITQNHSEGVRWLNRAAAQGHAAAQWILSGAYYSGTGVSKDDNAAKKLLIAAAEGGDAGAQYWLGTSYMQGSDLIEKSPQRGVTWLRRAAANGSLEGQYMLGMAYRDGTGVVADDGMAEWWFKAAAAQGDKKKLNEMRIHDAKQTLYNWWDKMVAWLGVADYASMEK